MPIIRPIQPTFSSGEVSPPIYARIDIQKYRTSLRTCRNFIVQPHGGVSNRPGTRYVATTKNSTLAQTTIVQDFIFNEDQAYILEFGDEYVRFFTDGASLNISSSDVAEWDAGTAYVIGDYVTLSGGTVYYATADNTGASPDSFPQSWNQTTIYERPTPYAEEDLTDLKFESSADVIYITHPDYQPRTLTRYGATDWRLELYDPQDGPFAPVNLDDISVSATATTGSVSLTSTSAIFAATDVGALFKLTHLIDGQKVSDSLTGTGATSSISAFATWRLITHGTWTAKFDIEKSSDGGTTWTVIRSFSSVDDFNVDTSGTEDFEVHTEPFLVRINVTSYTSGTLNIDLSSDAFFQDGILEITTFNSTTSVWGNTINDLGDTGNTTDWAHGAWSATRGYPAVSRFFQDRLCFAATTEEPQTLWMSRTGIYNSFLRHSVLLDTDGITINLPSRQINKINGLLALTRLIVFTTASEWSVGSSSTGVITPTTIDTRIESYRGSNGLEPIVVGNEAIYIQQNGKTVRNIGFELASDSFTGSELNILAKHLFEKWTITDLAYQQAPDSVIWALRSDGMLLGCTYLREQEVGAWHWHDTGALSLNGRDTIDSIAVIPNSTDNFDELWMVVTRENGVFIERMALSKMPHVCGIGQEILIQDQIRMDSAVSNDSPIDIVTITLTNAVNPYSPPIEVFASSHGLNDGDSVKLYGLDDFITLNYSSYQIGNTTVDTFDLLTLL